MEVFNADIAIVGAGGAGLRAAIAAAQADPSLRIALISKVYPMRSHTVAAEGGAAAVTLPHDSRQHHFDDTVTGGDWLCEQDVVDYFVAHCTEEMVQLEHWGCPWNRKDDGHVNVRAFGGMKIERTWFAADKTGFHMLHTLFQTSIKYPSIKRFDEHFCSDLIVEDGRCQGVLAIEIGTGAFTLIVAKAVIIATGGAGRVFRQNTNGGIVTGDGMALAYRQGVPLRDMEFVQYHPTCLPGTGLLMTEACRGEGGIMVSKDGYRYLQDYGLGPPDPWPRKKAMELGPRDRLSQAFWHEEQNGPHDRHPAGLRRASGSPAPRREEAARAPAADLRDWPRNSSVSIRSSRRFPCARGALHDGRDPGRHHDRFVVARFVLGGRMLERRHPRREPARFEFAFRAVRVRQGRRERGGEIRQVRLDRQHGGAAEAGRRRASARARTGQQERNRTHCSAAQRNGRQHGARLRNLSPRQGHASHLRQARRAQGALQERERRRTSRVAGTPNGCSRSSWATCSTWRRRWRIRP